MAFGLSAECACRAGSAGEQRLHLLTRGLGLHGGPGARQTYRKPKVAIPIQDRRCNRYIPAKVGADDRRIAFSLELTSSIFLEFADVGSAAEDRTPLLFDQRCGEVCRQSGSVDLSSGGRQHRDQPGTKLESASLISVLLEQADRAVVGPCGNGSALPRCVAQIGYLAADDFKTVDLL